MARNEQASKKERTRGRSNRNVILFMHKSLDGFVGQPNDEKLAWSSKAKDISKYMGQKLLQTVDTMLLGRVTYKGFERDWPAMAKDPQTPKEIRDFAKWIEDTPKMVFSKTLDKVGWKASTLVRVKNDTDIANAVRKLKQQPGGDMVVFGCASFAQTLARLGLIDEYQFKLEPVALGSGLPLFQGLQQPANLELTHAKAFKSGTVALYYKAKEE